MLRRLSVWICRCLRGFFADRIPGFDRGVSGKVFQVFREKGFVDDKGYMKRDRRRTPWRQALSGYKISLEESLVTPVEEELNLDNLTAIHSICDSNQLKISSECKLVIYLRPLSLLTVVILESETRTLNLRMSNANYKYL